MKYNYSVVVPYRDKYELFQKAVESIPDREDIQIIIVDNAPQSLPLEKIPTKDRAKVTYTTSSPTKGAGCARNEGLRYIEGKFVVFLDADDYFTSEAFSSFDKYLERDYDIVFFKSMSIKLDTGKESYRHKAYVKFIEEYLNNGNESNLRFWNTVPWAKLIRFDLIKRHTIQFDETRASNDLMFSVKTGFYAKKITASTDVVYVVTEAGPNQSIDKDRSKEAQFARFTVAVSQYEFMERIGRKDQRFSLLSYVLRSLKDFGFSEFLRYLRYAKAHNVNIFANKIKF